MTTPCPTRVPRQAACLALLAMLLAVTGPLIGQASAVAHAGHHPVAAMPAHAPATTDHETAVFTWHDQCGYCLLFQHCPVLDIGLAPIAPPSQGPLDQPAGMPQAAQDTPALSSHAPPRAPPATPA